MRMIRRWLFIYAIYVDVLILENAMLDAACLLLLGLYRDDRLPWCRILVSAFSGSVAGAFLLYALHDYGLYLFLSCVINLGMLFFTYGRRPLSVFFRDVGICFLLCVCLGGVVGVFRQWFPEDASRLFLPLGILCAVLALVACRYAKKQRKSYVEVSCLVDGEVKHFLAFCDTGNCLRDSSTGLPVCIVSEECIKRWEIDETTLFKIPYETLAGTGELSVYRPSFFCIRRGRGFELQKETLLGFGSQELFQGKDYQMILHREYCV